MVTIKDLGSLTKFQLAKALYLAGRLSWAVSVIEQEVLGDKFKNLSYDDQWVVHEWLYEGGLESASSEEELFSIIDEFFSEDGTKKVVSGAY